MFTLEEFKEGLGKEDVVSALTALHKSESDFVDHERSNYSFTIEVPQVFSGVDCRAMADNTWLKGFYVSQRHKHVSLAENQLHWISCHGALARDFIDILPYKKYMQCHRIESKVLDNFKALLGSNFESSDRLAGHAIGWMDMMTLPGLQTPEAQKMMGMLGQDIDIMTESTASHAFVTKEHFILNEPLFAEGSSLPTLFGTD